MKTTGFRTLCLAFYFTVSHSTAYRETVGSSHPGQVVLIDDEFIGDEFNGLGTFANLPYVNCLSSNEDKGGRYDIAILGAPFDTVSRAIPTLSLILADYVQGGNGSAGCSVWTSRHSKGVSAHVSLRVEYIHRYVF